MCFMVGAKQVVIVAAHEFHASRFTCDLVTGNKAEFVENSCCTW
jgi:hypothetical protein